MLPDLFVDMFLFSLSKYLWLEGLGYMACVSLILWSSQSVFQDSDTIFHSHHQCEEEFKLLKILVNAW